MTSVVDARRVRVLSDLPMKKGLVVYWMSRDQRINDNWALLYAQDLAIRKSVPLAVVFCLSPQFMGAGSRQYKFMLAGLKEVERDLTQLGIAFFLLYGDPTREIPRHLEEWGAGALVSDYSPLRVSRGWKNSLAAQIAIPFYEVDAHNIIPCWHASVKQEWAAYTFRPKVHRLLREFLVDFPAMKRQEMRLSGEVDNDWGRAEQSIEAEYVADIKWLKPGAAAARAVLDDFLSRKLSRYDRDRNDPTRDGQSNLSAYLHFGQISAQRAALQALSGPTDASAFLEELVVRRELADNFCCYNPQYDSVSSFPAWAKETLRVHQKDKREHLYSLKELEKAETHDHLWNASQKEMLHQGKMHGYLRMYWAKKILEWSQSPEDALQAAIYLNDRYELDGRDPNGFAGMAWSIGGLHDRAWKEREIFGKVRYMSYNGLRSKFNVPSYIKKIEALSG